MNDALLIRVDLRRRVVAWFGVWGLAALAGCGSLLPKPAAPPALFILEDSPDGTSATRPKQPRGTATATLIVAVPRAAPGYGTRQIVYVRTANQLESFAFSEWAEPPATMLAPLLANAIMRTGAFRAVVRAPVSAAGDLRLETELVRLQQDFSIAPSRVRLTVRAVLVDIASRRVLGAREFDAKVSSASEDPAGGVTAANDAAQRVAAEVGAFCAEWVELAK